MDYKVQGFPIDSYEAAIGVIDCSMVTLCCPYRGGDRGYRFRQGDSRSGPKPDAKPKPISMRRLNALKYRAIAIDFRSAWLFFNAGNDGLAPALGSRLRQV